MSTNQIEEIKGKVNIVDVIAEHVQLKRAGRNLKGICPFHSEKTPSFMVSPELQIFKCFGCSAGGDVYKFIMEFEKIDFPDALKILADRAGVKLEPLRGFPEVQHKDEIYRANYLIAEFYHYILTSHRIGEKALNYLQRRGVKEESVKLFKLGYAPDSSDVTFRFLTVKRGYKPEVLEKAGVIVKRDGRYFDRFRGRVIFPLNDHFGNVLGFSGRILEQKGDLAKYINSPETAVYKKGKILYGLEITKQEIKKEGFAVVVEGELDAISSYQAGVKNVVAIKGSALTEDQARLLSRFCQSIHLALDSDLAGNEAARRGAEVAQKVNLGVKVILLGDYKDPDEMAKHDPEAWGKTVKEAIGVYDFLIQAVFEKFNSTTAEGKANISRALTPMLAKIEDEIVKAHYVKLVAAKLGVSEEAVLVQSDKHGTKNYSTFNRSLEVEKENHKTRREVFEEYFLALILQSNPKQLVEAESIIQTPLAKRVTSEVLKWIQEKPFNSSVFAAQLPAELVDFFASLLLLDTETLLVSDSINKEIDNTKRELEILGIKEKMEELTKRIRLLETEGKVEESAVLQEELTQATKKLSTFG